MKGIFTNRLKIEFNNQRLHAYMYCSNLNESENVADYSNQTCEIVELTDTFQSTNKYIEGSDYTHCVNWYSTDAIDLLNSIEGYESCLAPIIPIGLTCNFKRSKPSAVIPTRAHTSDSGFDLTLLECIKTIGDVSYYTTGIQVDPPHGYYFDLVGRSSISKTGYMLANAIGIIDQSYRGDIIVPLRKVDKDAKDLELPVKLVQIIPRQWYNIQMIERGELDETSRNTGGFGSTN